MILMSLLSQTVGLHMKFEMWMPEVCEEKEVTAGTLRRVKFCLIRSPMWPWRLKKSYQDRWDADSRKEEKIYTYNHAGIRMHSTRGEEHVYILQTRNSCETMAGFRVLRKSLTKVYRSFLTEVFNHDLFCSSSTVFSCNGNVHAGPLQPLHPTFENPFYPRGINPNRVAQRSYYFGNIWTTPSSLCLGTFIHIFW